MILRRLWFSLTINKPVSVFCFICWIHQTRRELILEKHNFLATHCHNDDTYLSEMVNSGGTSDIDKTNVSSDFPQWGLILEKVRLKAIEIFKNFDATVPIWSLESIKPVYVAPHLSVLGK